MHKCKKEKKNPKCLHPDLRYCHCCKAVYCKNCGKEWKDKETGSQHPCSGYPKFDPFDFGTYWMFTK